MKKLLLLALLCLSFVASKAQIKVTNNTNCDIVVTPFCYDPVTCNIVNFCPATVVPAHTTIPLPPWPCQPPFIQGYQVCWVQCPNFCVEVAPPGRPCFPPQAVLPACSPCPPANVFVNAAGNITVQ